MSWFGLRPPQGTKTAAQWGCRAILTGRGRDQFIDILFDRQQGEPAGAIPLPFQDWMQGRFNKWIAANCDQKWIDPTGGETFKLDDGMFHAVACCNRSHGYLYVCAWMDHVF